MQQLPLPHRLAPPRPLQQHQTSLRVVPTFPAIDRVARARENGACLCSLAPFFCA